MAKQERGWIDLPTNQSPTTAKSGAPKELFAVIVIHANRVEWVLNDGRRGADPVSLGAPDGPRLHAEGLIMGFRLAGWTVEVISAD